MARRVKVRYRLADDFIYQTREWGLAPDHSPSRRDIISILARSEDVPNEMILIEKVVTFTTIENLPPL